MPRYQEAIKLNKRNTLLIIASLFAFVFSYFSLAQANYAYAFFPVVILGAVAVLILIFREPFNGLIITIAYCFLMGILDREIGGLPYGMGIEVFLLLTWLSVWYHADKFGFKVLNNDLIWLTVVWFVISVLELFNLAGASPRGWLQEIRSTALYPMLITPLGVLLINTNKRLNIFIILIFSLSFLATLNGIKQAKIGPTSGEQAFLDNGGYVTHVIFGHLRIFSFFSDASQFGPSQAHIALMAIVLALSLRLSWGKRILLLILGLLSFYGMLISGTRGALFVIAFGVIMVIALSKRLKILIWGSSIALFFFCILKFTYIGNSNYDIYRLRTSINPEDASFNVRLINQNKIAEYMQGKPFGGGLGVIGHWGREYNKDKYLSTIAPDSYWVKVWAMYGIVGFVIFFCIWLYWFGKCSGLLWNLKERQIRTKLIALLAGVAGIFVCSYGNEVMNAMPSLIVIHLSLGAVYAFSRIYKEKLTDK